MLAATAIRAALGFGLAGALTLVTDDADQLEAAASGMDRTYTGEGTRWEPERIWQSEAVKQGVKNPVIVVNSRWRSLLGSFRCSHPCTISTRREDIPTADAYVMNFCTPGFGNLPASKPSGQKWVFTFDFEAANDPWCLTHSPQQFLARSVDWWTMTYRPDSDVFRPAFSMAPIGAGSHEDFGSNWYKFSYAPSPVPNGNRTDWSAGRYKLLLWFVSNCEGKRLVVGAHLKKILGDQMDIFGGCGSPSPCPGHDELDRCHRRLYKRYKFYAALENTRCNGYLTEKWVRGMANGMVPVVWGGKNRGDYESIGLPRDSFIHSDDYNTTTELAEALMRLDADDDKYNSLHRWRATHRVVGDEENNHGSFCELCGKLSGRIPHRHKPRNVAKWWFEDTCERSNDQLTELMKDETLLAEIPPARRAALERRFPHR